MPSSRRQDCLCSELQTSFEISTIIFTQEKGDGGKAASLSIANVGGIFVVLLGGLALACLTACLEYVWTGRKVERSKKVRNLCIADVLNHLNTFPPTLNHTRNVEV